MKSAYVHGYSDRESVRLMDQANTLAELLHWDTRYPEDSIILESGCGVGAQTVTLAAGSPGAMIVSMDISEESLTQARQKVQAMGLTNVAFQIADIFNLPFAPSSFDHVFLCFVLEHLVDPDKALVHLRETLKPGGSITVIEGDHGSAYFHPDSNYARRAIQCLVDLQRGGGGDPLIGRRLYPLLATAGFRDIHVSPRMVYSDCSRPELVEGFTKKTFTAMVEGVAEQAISRRLIDETTWAAGIRDLYRTAEPDGTFCYTFFKAKALK